MRNHNTIKVQWIRINCWHSSFHLFGQWRRHRMCIVGTCSRILEALHSLSFRDNTILLNCPDRCLVRLTSKMIKIWIWQALGLGHACGELHANL